ncbi:2-oxoglutarate receptor 1 [Rhinophrynus dorsalis]
MAAAAIGIKDNNEPLPCEEEVISKIDVEISTTSRSNTKSKDDDEQTHSSIVVTEEVLTWANPLWETDKPIVYNFTEFVDSFRKIFDKPGRVASASKNLMTIRQGANTVADYSIEFHTLAAEIGWNNEALIAAFSQRRIIMSNISEYVINSTVIHSILQTSTNCTDFFIDYFVKVYYLPTLYSIIFIVGVPGNIIAISIYVMKMRPWRTSIIILLNLAITDLLHLSSLPFLVFNYVNREHWTLGDFMCKMIRIVFHFNLYGSILFLTCFSIFRYFVIVHPMKFHSIHKRRWAVIACIAVWVIALIEVLPMLILMTEIQDTVACVDFAVSFDTYNLRWYNAILTSIGFALPVVVVTLCYTCINRSLANGPYTNDAYKKKARRLVVILLVVFYACFLPLHIFRALLIETRLHPVDCVYDKQIYTTYIASRPIASLNTFGNLLLYVAVGGNFQHAIQSVYKCKPNPYKQQP